MKYLAVILLLSFVLQSSHALYPAGTKAVIIRIDDIQDYPATSPDLRTEKMLLQHQIDTRTPTLLAIIASDFGNDPTLVGQIRKGLDQGIFTIGIHGWTHSDYTRMSLSTQAATMEYAKNKLQTLFGVQVSTFIPPYDFFNDDTIAAMKTNGLTVISSAGYLGDFPREQDGITYIPGTVITANTNQTGWVAIPLEGIIQQIRASWSNYGVAIVVMHPQEFVYGNGTEFWNIYLQTLHWITSNVGTIIKLEPPPPNTAYAFDPIQLSVGILIGMISTVLVFTAVGKRNNGKRQREELEHVEQAHQPTLATES